LFFDIFLHPKVMMQKKTGNLCAIQTYIKTKRAGGQ
jgi:hypothetical protein